VTGDPTSITEAVRRFYENILFNSAGTAKQDARRARRNAVRAYPDVERLLRSPEVESVLEIGCGIGWFANSLAYHYHKRVLAIDLARAPLDRARQAAALLGVADRVEFRQQDLFAAALPAGADLVAAVGVLHHTPDAAAAFARAAAAVPAGKWLFVGLYHAPGRHIFLGAMAETRASRGEEAAYEHFRSLLGTAHSPAFIRSWFLDQVLHPHESAHTLSEVWAWCAQNGLRLESTSLNQFGPPPNREELDALDARMGELSYQRNVVEKRFFPGFFTVLARRVTPDPASLLSSAASSGPGGIANGDAAAHGGDPRR
jgi:2-polyprenyl-3-methyl-5-hydroxy-6-metoxy-1,4-benzoquinol methylase